MSPHLAQLGDRTGLGLAVVAQTPLPMQTRFAVEFAASVKRYNRTLLSLSGKPLALQYGYEWRPQDRFYGVGSSSSLDSVSDYAMQREFVRLSSHRTWGRDSSSARPRFVLDSWAGPRSVVTSNGREVPQFSYDERFPGLSAATLDRRTEHFVSGVSATVDERSGTPHWSRGWRMFGSAERFASPLRALALHSASDDGATFARFQLEAEAGVSRMRDPRTLRFLVHVTDQRVSAHRDHFLLSDLAKDVSGQIFAARKDEIYLFNQMRPIRSVHRSEGWSPRTLAEHMLPAVKPHMTAMERSGDVFSWDPV